MNQEAPMPASLGQLRHELYTPLNAIIGYSELLKEVCQDLGWQVYLGDLEKIRSESRSLADLVSTALGDSHWGSLPGDQPAKLIDAELDFHSRTALNTILGLVELTQESAEADGCAELIPDLGKIQHAARRFLELIERYSDLDWTPRQALAVEISAINPPINRDSRTDQQQEPDPDNAPGARILVVDDNPENRDTLQRYLSRLSLEASTAENGRQALEMLANRPCDLVLLDILMPEMDGYQVLKQLKSDPDLRDIPVIMISALDELDSVVQCIELGAEDYLPKPFNPVLLTARIHASLDKKRLRDMEVEYLKQVLKITAAAEAVELGNFEIASLDEVAARLDGLGQLARVFQRMAGEVYSREQRLKQQVHQLRIELDEARQARQVAEITETEYFQRLQSKAQGLRKIIDGE